MAQAVEVRRDGPQCTVAVTVPGSEIKARFSARLADAARQAKLPGFRPGKAPPKLLRKRYGASFLVETLRAAIDERADKAMEEAALRPSDRPVLDTPGEAYDLAALDAGRDFSFTLTFEPLPEVALADLKAMAFERLVAAPAEKDVDEAMANLAKSQAGEGAEPPEVDEAFAKSVGAEGLAHLRAEVTKRLGAELAEAALTRLKMQVMDALDAAHTFDAPPGLVEREYAEIQKDPLAEKQRAEAGARGVDLDDDAAMGAVEVALTEEEEAEYRAIAARRVRLALILATIAEQKKLAVSNEELGQAVLARARRWPGQEKAVFDMIVKNKPLLESIRASLLEDKAVDFVLEMATVTEREVTPEALFADEGEEKPAEESPKKAKKKAPAKKKAKAGAEPESKPKSDANKPKAKPKPKARKPVQGEDAT
ncbi:MAG TPA: hypothetical protein DDX54_03685 [Rhodospirillaceae bacterium]|jgi:FKBP-type peptidyl-prolyl cis-trans isomerase (trigger factor)|nr:hypothetical protein [Alphaproteobacteria bacterium]HBH26484.1 hypothetical protein [Rhodospirillaceae bacterium]